MSETFKMKLVLTISFFAFILGAPYVFAQSKCSHPYIDYTNSELKVREKWDNLGFKEQTNGLYIVTMIDLKYRNDIEYPSNSWAYKLLKNPDLISGNQMISASVISSAKQKTVFNSRVGLVLDVPCELIGPMYTWDMGSGAWQDEPLNIRYKKHFEHFPEVLTPKDFLYRSSPTYHNEVLVLGNYNDKKISVKGIVLGCEQSTSELFNNDITRIENLTKENLDKCLEKYPAKKQVVSELLNLKGKYAFYFKLRSYF